MSQTDVLDRFDHHPTPAWVFKQLKQRPNFFWSKEIITKLFAQPITICAFATLQECMIWKKSILVAPDVTLFSGAFQMGGLKSLLISVVNANFSDTQKSS